MNILLSNLILCVVAILALNGCCNMKNEQSKLDGQLNAYDIVGSIETINGPCMSKTPHIAATKALLLYKLSMSEKNKKEQARLKENAIKLLRFEAASGYNSAVSILESYDKIGDSYFLTFPWESLLGPGPSSSPGPRGF